jgi:hypothetical protein
MAEVLVLVDHAGGISRETMRVFGARSSAFSPTAAASWTVIGFFLAAMIPLRLA